MAQCRQIGIYLESVTVTKETEWEPGSDDVLVTAATRRLDGVPPPSESRWPVGEKDFSIKEGESAPSSPQPLVELAPSPDDVVEFRTAIGFFESDLESIDRALRLTVEEASRIASQQVPGPPGLIGKATALVDELVEAGIDLLGLDNELMEFLYIGARVNMNEPGVSLRKASWTPEEPEEIDQDRVRFKKTLSAHGGTWEVSLQVHRICEREE